MQQAERREERQEERAERRGMVPSIVVVECTSVAASGGGNWYRQAVEAPRRKPSGHCDTPLELMAASPEQGKWRLTIAEFTPNRLD